MSTMWGIANPEQLAALTKLLDEVANETGVADDKDARDRLAERIIGIFNEGVTNVGEIKRRLAVASR